MTTADIMFAQPGNPENLRDHEYETRTVLFALLAAILIHLLVAFFLAAFGGVFSPTTPVEDKPSELTFMDLAPTAPKNSAFIETDESKKRPNRKRKHLNRTPIRLEQASWLPLGNCRCRRRPARISHLWIWRHISIRSTLKGAQPQPSAAPQENPNPSAAPQTQPAPVTAAEQFAMLTQKPPQTRRQLGCNIATAIGVSADEAANTHRRKHHQSRYFFR